MLRGLAPTSPFNKGKTASPNASLVATLQARATGKFVSSNPIYRKIAVNPVNVERQLGRVEDAETGRIVSARLNPELAAQVAGDLAEGIIRKDKNTDAVLNDLVQSLQTLTVHATGGKGKRQRGGDDNLDDIAAMVPGIEGGVFNVILTTVQNNEEKIAVAKTIVQMAAYNAMWLAGEAVKPTADYLYKELADPLLKPGMKLAKIGLGLANQLVRVPITLALLSGASLGMTVNVAGKLLDMFNTWGRGTAGWMLQETTAKKVADAAVKDAKTIATTAGVAAIAANQLGVLPLSAVLAAILFSVQVNFGTGVGRAYVVSSFYTWYVSRPDEEKKAIKAAATQYAKDAGAAAKKGAKDVKDAAKNAAAALGPYLVKGGASAAAGAGAAGNAFKAVGEAIRANWTGPPGSAPAAAAIESSSNEEEGKVAAAAAAEAVAIAASQVIGDAPAAAEAAEEQVLNGVVAQAEAAAAPAAAGEPEVVPPPAQVVAAAKKERARRSTRGAEVGAWTGVKGGRKTRKQSTKRRVTRRRRAPKYLAAPVFAY